MPIGVKGFVVCRRTTRGDFGPSIFFNEWTSRGSTIIITVCGVLADPPVPTKVFIDDHLYLTP